VLAQDKNKALNKTVNNINLIFIFVLVSINNTSGQGTFAAAHLKALTQTFFEVTYIVTSKSVWQ
jgi:hypothetical protein